MEPTQDDNGNTCGIIYRKEKKGMNHRLSPPVSLDENDGTASHFRFTYIYSNVIREHDEGQERQQFGTGVHPGLHRQAGGRRQQHREPEAADSRLRAHEGSQGTIEGRDHRGGGQRWHEPLREAGRQTCSRDRDRRRLPAPHLHEDRQAVQITSDAIQTIDLLSKEHGIKVHIVDLGGQAIDTSNALGRFFLTVMSALAEMERGLISERTLEGMHYLKEETSSASHRAIYGWDHDENGDVFQLGGAVLDQLHGVAGPRERGHPDQRGEVPEQARHQGQSLSGAGGPGRGQEDHPEPVPRKRKQFERPDWWGSKVWHRVRTRKNKRVKKPKRPRYGTRTTCDHSMNIGTETSFFESGISCHMRFFHLCHRYGHHMATATATFAFGRNFSYSSVFVCIGIP